MRALFGTAATVGLLVLLAVPAAPLLSGCDSAPTRCESGVELQTVDTTPDSVTSFGATIRPTDCVRFAYTGRVQGVEEPFDSGDNVPLLVSRLITGFQRGVVGRRTGQSVRITIPPEQGYGLRSEEDIPKCSVLVFDVTILDTAPPSACR